MTSPRPLSGLFWCPIKMSFACSRVNVSSPWNKQNRVLLLALGPRLSPLIGGCPPCHHDIVTVCGEHSHDKWLLVSSFLSSLGLISGSYHIWSNDKEGIHEHLTFFKSYIHQYILFLSSFRFNLTGDWRLSRPVPWSPCSRFPQVSTNCPRLSGPITLRIHHKNLKEK